MIPLPAHPVARSYDRSGAPMPNRGWTDSEAAAMRAYGDAKATERQELICDRISDALSSDLENEVKWLSDVAADEFRKDYPALYKLIKELNG